MLNEIQFKIVMPSNVFYSSYASLVTLPGEEGEFGVMHGHAPMIINLAPGIVRVDETSNKKFKFFVYGGIARVNPNELSLVTKFASSLDEELNKANLSEKISLMEKELSSTQDVSEQDVLMVKIARIKTLLDFIPN